MPMPRVMQPKAANAVSAKGRLVLFVSDDAGHLDIVLQALASRADIASTCTFAQPLTTRLLPAGGGVVITRNGLEALIRTGALVLSWTSNGRVQAHGENMLAKLRLGETVIVGAGSGTEAAARALWPDTRIVQLQANTDRMRAPLSQQMHSERAAAKADAMIRDDGDLAATIRRASDVVRALLPMPVHRVKTRRLAIGAKAGLARTAGPQALIPAAT